MADTKANEILVEAVIENDTSETTGLEELARKMMKQKEAVMNLFETNNKRTENVEEKLATVQNSLENLELMLQNVAEKLKGEHEERDGSSTRTSCRSGYATPVWDGENIEEDVQPSAPVVNEGEENRPPPYNCTLALGKEKKTGREEVGKAFHKALVMAEKLIPDEPHPETSEAWVRDALAEILDQYPMLSNKEICRVINSRLPKEKRAETTRFLRRDHRDVDPEAYVNLVTMVMSNQSVYDEDAARTKFHSYQPSEGKSFFTVLKEVEERSYGLEIQEGERKLAVLKRLQNLLPGEESRIMQKQIARLRSNRRYLNLTVHEMVEVITDNRQSVAHIEKYWAQEYKVVLPVKQLKVNLPKSSGDKQGSRKPNPARRCARCKMVDHTEENCHVYSRTTQDPCSLCAKFFNSKPMHPEDECKNAVLYAKN